MAERPLKTKPAKPAAAKPAPPASKSKGGAPAKAAPAPKAATGPEVINLSDIKELFALMKENGIAELNLEQHGTKIHILSSHAPVAQPQMMPVMQGLPPVVGVPAPSASAPAAEPAPAPVAASAPSPAPAVEAAPALPANVKEIRSPMVGTFYRSPAPDAPPFVNAGDRVGEDTTLCIIEAMKLMNEIKCEMRGKVHKILAENGQPVEFDQPLFLIESE